MALDINVSLIVEIVLAALLAATLFYCVLLERRLRNLRNDQAELSKTIGALNSGIARAQGSLASLRTAAADAGDSLDRKIGAARGLADELLLLASSGERIATRIETARESIARAPAPPRAPSRAPALAENLRAVR